MKTGLSKPTLPVSDCIFCIDVALNGIGGTAVLDPSFLLIIGFIFSASGLEKCVLAILGCEPGLADPRGFWFWPMGVEIFLSSILEVGCLAVVASYSFLIRSSSIARFIIFIISK